MEVQGEAETQRNELPRNAEAAEEAAAARATLGSVSWDAETTDLIRWFQSAPGLLDSPFPLSSGVTVIDPPGFYRFLAGVIAGGSTGPYARLGQLGRDLLLLYRRVQQMEGQAGS